ncbi:MAG: PD40 domain-containing protein [Chloroflexi bacterium]|nr:PD40 domain-containing protein [Chloroflexota bacterium]
MNSVWKSKVKFGALFILSLLLLYAGHYFVTPKTGLQLDLVWSPDSKHVAYVCRYHYRTDYQKDGINLPGYKRIDDVNTGEICMFDLETNRFERLTYGRYKTDPSWLPDGSRLSWYDKKNGLAVYDLRTGETVFDVNLIYDPEQYEQNDELSPDGRYLIDYIGGGTADDPYDGFFFTIIENEQVLFKSDFKIAPVPAWSPSSSMLGLRKYGWHDFVFMRFPEIEITSFQTQHPFDFVSWSPDGKTIAFQNHEFLQIVVFEFRANPFSFLL